MCQEPQAETSIGIFSIISQCFCFCFAILHKEYLGIFPWRLLHFLSSSTIFCLMYCKVSLFTHFSECLPFIISSTFWVAPVASQFTFLSYRLTYLPYSRKGYPLFRKGKEGRRQCANEALCGGLGEGGKTVNGPQLICVPLHIEILLSCQVA